MDRGVRLAYNTRMMTIAIRDLTTVQEFIQVREIQRQCWGFAQDEGLYPPVLNTAAHNGGTVLGAFDGDRMIGFLFGFLGLHEGRRLKLCSQTMGVLSEYRNRGVTAALKWAQRERVLALGIDLITWTYDPLEAPNARLNLHALGAIAHTYQRNVYGENFGALGRGLPSDRFLAEWWLTSERAARCAAGKEPETTPPEAPIVNACSGAGGGRRIDSLRLDLDAHGGRVEIPVDIQDMKTAKLSLALEWRTGTRQIFEAYFARGYQAVDVLKMDEEGTRRNFYVLRSGR